MSLNPLRLVPAIVLAVLLLGAHAGAAAGQERSLGTALSGESRKTALVVGNDGYEQTPLRNARNDARTVARVLGELGFKVTLLEDANRPALTNALARFGDDVGRDDVAFFFFAGHGVQVDGENYLLPVDFHGASPTEIRLNTLGASEIQAALARARVSILVLDACRNNPFGGKRAGGGGLAPMEARGSLVAFATGAGQTASDSPQGANGLFTAELIKALQAPGLSIRDVLYRVRVAVDQASRGRQTPAVYDGLLGDFVFRPAPVAHANENQPAARPAPGSDDADLARREELALWESIKDSRQPDAFQDYLNRYPNGRFRTAAAAKLADVKSASARPVNPATKEPASKALPRTEAGGSVTGASDSADAIRRFVGTAEKPLISETCPAAAPRTTATFGRNSLGLQLGGPAVKVHYYGCWRNGDSASCLIAIENKLKKPFDFASMQGAPPSRSEAVWYGHQGGDPGKGIFQAVSDDLGSVLVMRGRTVLNKAAEAMPKIIVQDGERGWSIFTFTGASASAQAVRFTTCIGHQREIKLGGQ